MGLGVHELGELRSFSLIEIFLVKVNTFWVMDPESSRGSFFGVGWSLLNLFKFLFKVRMNRLTGVGGLGISLFWFGDELSGDGLLA